MDMSKLRTACVAGDFHVAYDDPKQRTLWFDFLDRVKPDEVILNGDVMDFYAVSRFCKDPDRATPSAFQGELEACRELLAQVRHLLPQAKLTYVEGNHERRWRKYLWANQSVLSGLEEVELPRLLRLEEMGVGYEEDGVWLGDLFVYHGRVVRKHSGYSARAELELNGCSGLSNHTHRDGHHGVRNRAGVWGWWENFCMCQLDPEYVEGVANWTPGWSLVSIVEKRPHVEQIMTKGYKYVWGGELVEWTRRMEQRIRKLLKGS